jgi:hypothetical protein
VPPPAGADPTRFHGKRLDVTGLSGRSKPRASQVEVAARVHRHADDRRDARTRVTNDGGSGRDEVSGSTGSSRSLGAARFVAATSVSRQRERPLLGPTRTGRAAPGPTSGTAASHAYEGEPPGDARAGWPAGACARCTRASPPPPGSGSDSVRPRLRPFATTVALGAEREALRPESRVTLAWREVRDETQGAPRREGPVSRAFPSGR